MLFEVNIIKLYKKLQRIWEETENIWRSTASVKTKVGQDVGNIKWTV